MLKYFSIALLGVAGFLSTARAAEACGGGCCASMAPATCAAMPNMPGMTAPPAAPQANAGTQVNRSYSYEPSTSNRSYGRTNRPYRTGEFDAGRKIRGL
jgi:hypothetical protein